MDQLEKILTFGERYGSTKAQITKSLNTSTPEVQKLLKSHAKMLKRLKEQTRCL